MRSKPILHYFSLYGQFKLQLTGMFFLYIVKHGAWMAYPLILKFVIDDFIPGENIFLLFMCIPAVAVLGLINLSCHTPFQVLSAKVVKGASMTLRSRIVHKLQILSLSFLNKSETGRYYSKIMLDVTKCETFARMFLNQVLASFFTLLYALVILAVINLKLLGVYLLTFPIYILIYRGFRGRFRKYQHAARMADEDLSQSVSQFIQTSLLSKIHGEEDYERSQVDTRGRNIIDRYKAISKFIGMFQILVASSGQVFQITILAFCGMAVINGKMSIGELVVFFQYTSQLVGSLKMVLDVFPQFTEFRESMTSIHEVLESSEVEANEGKRRPGSLEGAVSFEDVVFAYEPGKPALNGVSVNIQPGQTVALVGPSGSGKTTFVNMLLGLIRAEEGVIRLDGDDVNNLDMRFLRQQVGVVTQEPILFKASIAENIAYARAHVTREDIETAARMANAHDFITQTPDGYDSIVGERGATLSGGQKQRIAIARAILRRPGILVLDEATSALDSISEREVQKGIESVLGNQTTITIAHRLSTIMHADVILVFLEGRIAEQGSHRELLDKNGVYAGLYKAQHLVETSEYLVFDRE
jgi:ATP-binding cassette subfamily B protein